MNIDILPLLSFVVITTFTPGPNNISSASMGIIFGYKKSLNYLLGITAGFSLVMAACSFFSSTLLIVIPSAEKYLRVIGALYILYLAIGILKADYSYSDTKESIQSFSKGLILQLFNPKAIIYGLTIYTTFLASLSGFPVYLAFSVIAFAFVTFTAISTWAIGGAIIKKQLKNERYRKAVNTILSLMLVYTAFELSGVTVLLKN